MLNTKYNLFYLNANYNGGKNKTKKNLKLVQR